MLRFQSKFILKRVRSYLNKSKLCIEIWTLIRIKILLTLTTHFSGDDYKKAIFGDPDELKKAIAERRKEEANDLKQDFIDKTLSEIS